ncbi:ABC transporter permease [Nitrosophilus alvini]|uniref:ABC transporter permease n=1 Tax=Nitrosophilus alvini TaxID=2714855 RepID=UPI001F26625B|nr:ABC transporter permease [Nitrosophilus alvini]
MISYIKQFWTIVAKELFSFLRSWGLVAVVLYSFTLDIYIAGKGISLEAKNISVGVFDNTSGALSNKIVSSLHKPQFKKPVFFKSEKELQDAIFNRDIMMGLIFDSDFEKEYFQNKNPRIDVILDSTAATQAYMALQYLANIAMDVSKIENLFPIELKIHKLFNENAENSYFMAISEMLSIITLIGVILSAAVFVKEKEQGTWDMMLLMPINSKITILAKSFSQVIIILVGTFLSVGLILFGAFDVPLNGSLMAFFALSFFFTFTIAGIGLFIAAASKSMMQVTQLSVIIMMPLIFLSGAWTPIYAMHPVLQYMSLFSPLRFYIEGTESIFFRGTPIEDLWIYFAGVLILGIPLFLYGFRKIGKLF